MGDADGLTILRIAQVRRADFQMPEDVYAGWALISAEEGVFRYEMPGVEEGEAEFGDMVFCPPGVTLRRAARTPRIAFLFCEWQGDEAGELPSAGRVCLRDTARLVSTLQTLRATATYQEPDRNRWRVHLLRDLLFLASAARQETAPIGAAVVDPLAAEAARRIQAADREGGDRVTLEQIARAVGVSPARLTRRFAAAYGRTPAEYRTALRLDRARALLTETDWTLDRVADACGYRDAFYLSRVFRRAMGAPPSEYRRRHRV
jgi:AraC-like DNA-binding protein